ncbi:MAG: ubiquitin-like protein Pup [Cellulomonadaceae bacterium]|jgi:ubiquitin-like protein Pup|nr:ubiquitin-like protein Pup [Cellulomonadaceae bacterium]
MAEQTHISRQRHDDFADDGADSPIPASPTVTSAAADLDAILDEIDDVLEVNAQEFVRGFVQKGGQ